MSENVSLHRRSLLTRRQFLLYSGLGAAALGLSACAAPPLPATFPAASTTPQATAASSTAKSADLTFRLTVKAAEVPIFAGSPTRVLTYVGEVLEGAPDAVMNLPDSYLGPIVRTTRGQRVRVHVHNTLSEPTNVHWHGLIVPAEMDGHPSRLIEPGQEAVYEFEVRNRPGTYWFHPHPHERTAEQAYRGLAGLFLVTDEEEAALGLPAGAQELPLILQDRRFDRNHQLVYIAAGMAGMMEQMMGFLGEEILVNGRPNAAFSVATRPYRLRILNGSNARIYKLAWSDGAPMIVIGGDGGLLERPLTYPYVMLSPGERVELWTDFSQRKAGEEVKLVSLPFEGVEAGPMQMMMAPEPLPNGAAFEIAAFHIAEAVNAPLALPEQLLPFERLSPADAVNADHPRTFIFAMDDQMNWTINGRRFEMDVVADDEKVRFGATEVWELINVMDAPVAAPNAMHHGAHMQHGGAGTMGGMMAGMKDFMAHPVHVHGVHFQVLDRSVDDAQRRGWETVNEGLLDSGWKDTILLMPGERVRILVRFDGYRGVYLLHCHNLEHEDSGMMRNFEIV